MTQFRVPPNRPCSDCADLKRIYEEGEARRAAEFGAKLAALEDQLKAAQDMAEMWRTRAGAALSLLDAIREFARL